MHDTPHATNATLDRWRRQVEEIILARQDRTTGLLPASTAITVHGDYTHAWVRDNVYSILAAWALALAYRRAGSEAAAPLEAAVAKLMRGLLAAMMCQAHKVEAFKRTQDPLDALHAKYDTQTGEPVVGDAEWGHLQLDATALYLLFFARMSAAGLPIARSADEAAFVQNLVHYLAKTYRTPDYGIWERGHKRNEGRAEINASSVGMAKAALEAIAGMDLLPGRAPAITVLADDIAHARDTLEGLLPRESESKETDAALLAVIGFPAFAVEDEALVERTRAEIVSKLEGRYGCKRFLRDGHQTMLEDHSRLHYEPGELGRFEHIESEWPLFFTYLLLDAALRGDDTRAADYRTKLDALFVERDGVRLLPELYFVPADAIAAERAAPHSQVREPNANLPLVWAQSLYIVGVLVQEGFVDTLDLDPLAACRANTPPQGRVVNVAIVAEDNLVRGRLASHGIACDTVRGVAPIEIGFARRLQSALFALGRCDALGLSGRPADPLGVLACCQLYTHRGRRHLFLPPLFDRPAFYRLLDNRLLVDEIRADIAYIGRHWRQPGRPLMVLPLTAPMLDAPAADVLVEMLRAFVDGEVDGVRFGRLAALLPDADRLSIDWLAMLPEVRTAAPPSAEVEAVLGWDEAATRPLTAARAAALEREADAGTLAALLGKSRNPYEQVEVLGLLWARGGGDAALEPGGSVRRLTEALYARASRQRRWGVLRRAAGLLDLHDERLEDALAHIVVHQKRVAIGRHEPEVLVRPCGNAEIVARLRAHGGADPRARVLIEEVLLALGTLIRADPQLFAGTLTLRVWHLVRLLNGWLAREHGVSAAEAFDHLLDLSPQAILARLREVIAREREFAEDLRARQGLRRQDVAREFVEMQFPAGDDPVLAEAGGGWSAWREMTGVLTRVPEDFYARVWDLLEHCDGLVIGDALDLRNRLDSAELRADTTPAEQAFALQVEDRLNRLPEAAYRQLTIEALLAVSRLWRGNPGLRIDGDLEVDPLLFTAVAFAWRESAAERGADGADPGDAEIAQAWQHFFALPPHRVARSVCAAFEALLHTPGQDAALPVVVA